MLDTSIWLYFGLHESGILIIGPTKRLLSAWKTEYRKIGLLGKQRITLSVYIAINVYNETGRTKGIGGIFQPSIDIDVCLKYAVVQFPQNP